MRPRRYLLDAELAAFMRAVRDRRHRNNVRDHAFFSLLANTGIRPGEALALTRADVRIGQVTAIRVRRLKTGADLVADVIQLTPELAAIVRRRVDQLGPSPGAKLFPVGARTAQRVFKCYARRCGLARGLRLYVLRHTAATRMYRSTRNIALVQAMLGHKSPDTTAIYAHIPTDVLQGCARTLQGA
jgi:integrase/recombinase XerD